MSGKDRQPPYEKTRSGPRVKAAIEVDVEVAGQTKKVKLLSRDIGTGGMFLRTREPAPLWKQVRIVLKDPAGRELEIRGEVVRSVTPEAASKSKYPPGMAIAFDEASRAKRKQLVEMVLELCTHPPAPPPAAAQPAPKPGPQAAGTGTDESRRKKDAGGEGVLDEIDHLLEDLEENREQGQEENSTEIELDIELPTGGDETAASAVGQAPAADSQALREALHQYHSTCRGETHYHALGVPLDATPEQITAAYQRLVASLEPGATSTLDNELRQQVHAVLSKIRKAYAILSKPDRKKAYDFLIDNLPEGL